MRDLNVHYAKWKVSLNNGETLYECKGDYQQIPGQPSPWQRLQKYISKNKLEITSLSLYTDKGQTWQMPSAGSNPKFREFDNVEKPLDYDMCRKMAREAKVIKMVAKKAKVVEWYTVIKAFYKDYTLEVWVDELNPKSSWTIVRDNE
jgi:hypothetical protein